MDQDPGCPLCQAISAGGSAMPVSDDRFVVLDPLQAHAPVHLLVVPRRHTGSAHDFVLHDPAAAALLITATEVAERAGILDSGYRLVLNSGPATDQTVHHPHLHVIGGERLSPHPSSGHDDGPAGAHHEPRPGRRPVSPHQITR